MYIFVGNNRNVLIYRSLVGVAKSAFRLPELDIEYTAIVTSTRVRPMPAYQVHGSVGGLSYINVFGEEPVNITLSGMVAGSNCEQLRTADSALGLTVDMFRKLGVVERATPLRYRVGRSRMRSAYLIGLDASQEAQGFADIAKFTMQLIAEPFAEIADPKPIGKRRKSRSQQSVQDEEQPPRQRGIVVGRPAPPEPGPSLPISATPSLPDERPAMVGVIVNPRANIAGPSRSEINLSPTTRFDISSRAPVRMAARGETVTSQLDTVAENFILSSSGDPVSPTAINKQANGFKRTGSGVDS